MKTSLTKLIEYLESKDYDHDLLSGAIVGLSETDIVRYKVVELLEDERQMVEVSFDAGATGVWRNGGEFFDEIYDNGIDPDWRID